ncbi:MAG: hypothetical protein QOH21_2205, partial [Acidobacteriota bacterium]|nr:hypothetical protein [Acidobacteriota bacterium]
VHQERAEYTLTRALGERDAPHPSV